MEQWINQTLESGTFSVAVLLAAFLLGLLSSIATATCSFPVLGAIVGYSGTQKPNSFRANILAVASFMLGTIIAVMILGSVAGFIGQIAQSNLGRYWKLFAGFVAIIFGLGTLKLLPFNLSLKTSKTITKPQGMFTAILFGMGLGGAVSVCSLCCNPGILIVMSVVVLQGYNLWAMFMLAAYAIGFSLPLAAIILGVSFGKMAAKAKYAETVIRIIAGVLLIVAGFYFMRTI